jgi:hypothetical protein
VRSQAAAFGGDRLVVGRKVRQRAEGHRAVLAELGDTCAVGAGDQ